MVDDEEYFSKNFYIAERHEKLLNKINSNSSLALRTVLDSIIRGERHRKITERLDKLLIRISLGFIMILMSYLMTDPLISIITLLIGIGIVCYATTEGIIDAIQSKREK